MGNVNGKIFRPKIARDMEDEMEAKVELMQQRVDVPPEVAAYLARAGVEPPTSEDPWRKELFVMMLLLAAIAATWWDAQWAGLLAIFSSIYVVLALCATGFVMMVVFVAPLGEKSRLDLLVTAAQRFPASSRWRSTCASVTALGGAATLAYHDWFWVPLFAVAAQGVAWVAFRVLRAHARDTLSQLCSQSLQAE